MNLRAHPDATAFKSAAQQYCALFQADPAEIDPWVESVLAALAQVYAAAFRLPDFGISEDAPDIPEALDVTREEWGSVFGIVSRALGSQEFYWAYFDPSAPPDSNQAPVFQSLADDLADIYRDLQPGVRAWETGDDRYLEEILFNWKTPNFGSHWGCHAVSAMRALHPIVFLRGVTQQGFPSLGLFAKRQLNSRRITFQANNHPSACPFPPSSPD